MKCTDLSLLKISEKRKLNASKKIKLMNNKLSDFKIREKVNYIKKIRKFVKSVRK